MAAHQAPPSLGFSRQEYWSGLPFPPPENLPDPEIKPVSPALAGGFFTTEPPGKPTGKILLLIMKELIIPVSDHFQTNLRFKVRLMALEIPIKSLL